MSENVKAILKLIEEYPEESVSLYRALWAILPNQQQQIIKVIATQGSIGVTNITQIMAIRQSNISSQLSKLRKLGLVEDKKLSKEVFYSLPIKHSILGSMAIYVKNTR